VKNNSILTRGPLALRYQIVVALAAAASQAHGALLNGQGDWLNQPLFKELQRFLTFG
jgi:hypothetical protein